MVIGILMKFKISLALTMLFGCLALIFTFIPGMGFIAVGFMGITIIAAIITNYFFLKER